MERKLARRKIYSGRVITLFRDTVRIGKRSTVRELITHPGSAVMIPVLDPASMKIILIRQYRYAAKKYLYELPAGTREGMESLRQTARREIIEETGYSAGKVTRVTGFYLAPGTMDEQMDLFIAMRLKEAVPDTEFDEDIRVKATTLDRAVKMVESGDIIDAKTIAGIMLLKHIASTKRLRDKYLRWK